MIQALKNAIGKEVVYSRRRSLNEQLSPKQDNSGESKINCYRDPKESLAAIL